MKRLLFSCLISFSVTLLYAQNCLPGGINFTSQTQIDNFTSDYPGCINIEGDVTIETGSIVNLNGLSVLTSIEGALEILETELINLEGVENIQSLPKSLKIDTNPNLESIGELGNTGVFPDNFRLIIKDNPNLSVCSSIPVCSFINKKQQDPSLIVDIRDNAPGCNSIIEIFVDCDPKMCLPSGIRISDQDDIDRFLINYPNCSKIYGNVSINECENLRGFQNIDTIWSNLTFGGNIENGFSDLTNLKYVGGYFQGPYDSEDRDFTGLENLNYLGGFEMPENPTLKNFQGLSGLEKIGAQGLVISDCYGLEDFSGFDNLLEIEGEVQLNGIRNAKELFGFPKLKIIRDDIYIDDIIAEKINLFNSVEYISGKLYLESLAFEELTSFQNLRTIDGDIYLASGGSQVEMTINSFQKLDTVFGRITLRRLNKLIEFDNFNNLKHIDGDLNFILNQELKVLEGFDALRSISGTLRLSDHINLYDFSAFKNLQLIGNQLTITENPLIGDLSSFSKLNSVREIDIQGSQQLTSLNGLHSFNPTTLKKLNLVNNSNLAICNNLPVCTYLTDNGSAIINNNAAGCNSTTEVHEICNPPQFNLTIITFYDSNQDGVRQMNERYLTDASVKIDSLAIFSGRNLTLIEGDYEIELITPPNWKSVGDSILNVRLDSANVDVILYFGLYPENEVSELRNHLNGFERCNTFQNFIVTTKNTGTSLPSGIIWIEIDSSVTDVEFINTPDHTDTPNLFGWNFDSLLFGNSISRIISFEVAGPPEAVIGDSLRIKTYTTFMDKNGSDTSSVFVYERAIRCSFDPNDKLVNPTRPGNYTLFDEDLIYTVRFQNTGNDVAYDVTVRDTLDNNLNPQTFRLLSTSHPDILMTSIEENKFMTFDFKNIFLPDSTSNLEESQGFISYSIKPIEGLMENTPINNTASIYFDFNPPIVTNTTENLMVSELPTSSSQNIDNQLLIHVFPNPTTGNFFLKGDNLKNAILTITDFTGRILKQEKLNERQEVSLPETAQGMFFLKVETLNGTAVQKVIKM